VTVITEAGKKVVSRNFAKALLGAAASVLTAVMVIQEIEQETEIRKRRRKRSQKCALLCLEIIESAIPEKDINEYFRKGGFWTDEAERRTRRTFRSRA
jgi:hypothetical protein